MQQDFDGVIDRHFELNRVSSDTIVLGKPALSSDDQALAGIKPSRTAYIHEDNVVVGKRMRRAARRHSPSPSYTTSSPRMNKRSLKDSDTRGKHDIGGPKDPVKRIGHALPTIRVLEESEDDEEVMFIEVRKPQGTLSKATYGPAILGRNGSLYYRSRSTLYAGRVFKFALVNEVVNGTVTRRFYHCADCRETTSRPLVTIITHNDVLVERDPDEPLGVPHLCVRAGTARAPLSNTDTASECTSASA